MATSIYKRCYVSWDSVPVMLSLSEASVLLRMPEDTVRKHLESGALPGIKIGRQWRLEKTKLQSMFKGGV